MNIVAMPKKAEDDLWKRRLALQIATQLPEKATDALAVIALVQALVTDFLASGGA